MEPVLAADMATNADTSIVSAARSYEKTSLLSRHKQIILSKISWNHTWRARLLQCPGHRLRRLHFIIFHFIEIQKIFFNLRSISRLEQTISNLEIERRVKFYFKFHENGKLKSEYPESIKIQLKVEQLTHLDEYLTRAWLESTTGANLSIFPPNPSLISSKCVSNWTFSGILLLSARAI